MKVCPDPKIHHHYDHYVMIHEKEGVEGGRKKSLQLNHGMPLLRSFPISETSTCGRRKMVKLLFKSVK